MLKKKFVNKKSKMSKPLLKSASKKSRKSKMFSKMLFAVLISLLTMSCSTTGPAPILVSDYCESAQPIYLAKEEIPVLTRETKSQILIHNKIWQRKCGNKS